MINHNLEKQLCTLTDCVILKFHSEKWWTESSESIFDPVSLSTVGNKGAH